MSTPGAAACDAPRGERGSLESRYRESRDVSVPSLCHLCDDPAARGRDGPQLDPDVPPAPQHDTRRARAGTEAACGIVLELSRAPA
jgi:hypothetical protein